MWGVLVTGVWMAAAVPAVEPPEVPPPHVYAGDTRLAVVASERQPQVSFVVAHCEALQRYLELTLGMPPLPPPLARLEIVDIPGWAPVDCRLVGGTVLTVVRLDDALEAPSRAAEAVARTWVARTATAGRKSIGASEGWVRQALACETLVSLRPAMNDYWFREGRRATPALLTEILAGQAPEGEAFLFWRAFRGVLGSLDAQTKAIIDSAQGGSAAAVLKSLGRSPQEWWLTARAELLISRSPVSLGLRESAESLDDIARFVFDLGAGDVVVSGATLPQHRALPAIRTSLAGRLLSLRREILRQNPVYHNAWRTFGVWLERFPDGTPEELALLWTEYVAERGQADKIRHEVELALAGVPTK